MTADMHNPYLHIQKEKRKKCFLHSYHSALLLIHCKIFNFNINIQFCYLLYIVFSFFLFFFPSWSNVKLYRSIEQLCCSFINSKNRTTLSQRLIFERSQVQIAI